MRFRRRPDQETAMKAKRLWNERTRLILIMELAIVLPAAVLVILSATHLKHIQRDRGVEALFQREFGEALAISEKRLNHKAYELMDDVRKDFPAPGNACSGNLDRILAGHPYVAHVFLYTPEGGIVFRSQPYRLQDSGFHQEAEYLSTMFAGWFKVDFSDMTEKLTKLQKKGTPYYFDGTWSPRGDKRVYQTIAIFHTIDEKTGTKALAGIAFDGDYLRDQFFPQMLNEVMSRNVAEAQTDKNTVIMVHGKSESSPLAACDGWDGGTPEVERNMEAVFPGLALGIKLRGTTLAAIGQHFFRSSFLTLAGLSLVLACGIALTYEEKIDEVPPLRVDREAMARSLVNLVNNALKYSQDRKFIGVSLYRDNGSIKLEVVDHGIGIPHQEQSKIFEKFYRVGDPLVHNTKGSGLGLSLVRHIAQAHGGDVLVDSSPGQGSKFTITLPMNPAENRSTAATA